MLIDDEEEQNPRSAGVAELMRGVCMILRTSVWKRSARRQRLVFGAVLQDKKEEKHDGRKAHSAMKAGCNAVTKDM